MRNYITALVLMATLTFGAASGVSAETGMQNVVAYVDQDADDEGIEAFSDTTVDDTVIAMPQQSYSVHVGSDDFDGMMKHFNMWTGGLFGMFTFVMVLIILAPLILIALIIYLIYRNRKQKMYIDKMARENGQPTSANMQSVTVEPSDAEWRSGIRNVSIGLGLACLFYFIDLGLGIGIGLLLACYGAGQMFMARSASSKKKKDDEPHDYEEHFD